MSDRPFRLAWTVHDLPAVLRLAPPTPELYEELCRVEVERIARIPENADRGAGGEFTDVEVELLGTYPEARIRITGRLDGRPAAYDFDLYRPRFHRMRHGRLRSPNQWGETVYFRFCEPLDWLWPNDDPSRQPMLTQELHEMAGSFSAHLRGGKVKVLGERQDAIVEMTLFDVSGDRSFTVQAPLWEGEGPRALWKVGEGLRTRMLDAAGLSDEIEPPTLTLFATDNHEPSPKG